MLSRDLIEVVNGQQAWAFVGSGFSADAGYPSWQVLLDGVLAGLDQGAREEITSARLFERSYSEQKYPESFDVIQSICGKELLDRAICRIIMSTKPVHGLTRLIANWPFAGYITTNYDGLIETELHALRQRGWIAIGNSESEIPKVASDATGIVWHIHGSCEMERDRSRLVVSETDYDELYGSDTLLVRQIKALLTQRRLVFFGVGFRDNEFIRLLKAVGAVSTSARPGYAFVGGLTGKEHSVERRKYLEKYNLDTIPYSLDRPGHHRLRDMVQTHGAFVLKRELLFGKARREIPRYDPDATGLLVYNTLVLNEGFSISNPEQETLVRSRILSLVHYGAAVGLDEIAVDLGERIRLLNAEGCAPEDPQRRIAVALDRLAGEGFIEFTTDGSAIELTATGRDLVAGRAAQSARLRDQFGQSVLDRVLETAGELGGRASAVAEVATAFLEDTLGRRALGVAQVLFSSSRDIGRFHIVALLQQLPEYLEQLGGQDEAIALVAIVQEMLAAPTEEEKRYLALVLQARFGAQLLGYDPRALAARIEELSRTLFLIDSTTLIPLFASGSTGFDAANLLVDSLLGVNASVCSTALLVEEVAEHARWPLEGGVIEKSGATSPETVAASQGREGYRRNVFLDGFVNTLADGDIGANYLDYMYRECQCSIKSSLISVAESFIEKAEASGVKIVRFGEYEAFSPELWVERDNLQVAIAQRRKSSDTYTHSRQVKAEAEALIIVEEAKAGNSPFPVKEIRNAYFVSHTRILDQIRPAGYPVTIRPEAVMQLMSTVRGCAPEELQGLVDQLLWELSERDMALVDRHVMRRAFSDLISAAATELDEQFLINRARTAERYGAERHQAFSEKTIVDLPVFVRSYFAQEADQLRADLARERQLRQKEQEKADLTDKEKEELEKYRQRRREKEASAERRKRALRSGQGKRKRK